MEVRIQAPGQAEEEFVFVAGGLLEVQPGAVATKQRNIGCTAAQQKGSLGCLFLSVERDETGAYTAQTPPSTKSSCPAT